ncbi:MAG: O-antigen ligase family protein, partial [Bacteroidota bacterium]
LYLAFFFMPIGINLPSPFFVGAMVFGLALIPRQRKEFIFEPYLLLFPLYFILLCIGLLYTENLKDGLNLVQRSLSLLFFPMIFMFVKEDSASVSKLFQFLLAGLLTSFFFNFLMATNALATSLPSATFNEGFLAIIEWINTHWTRFYMGGAFSKAVNPNYISIYLLLVLSYYLKNKLISFNRLLVILILFTYVFLLGSISAYVVLALISIRFILDVREKQKKYLGVMLFILGALVFIKSPGISISYKFLKNYHAQGIQKTTPEKAKLLSWATALGLITDEPILGYGTGDANDVLAEEYLRLNYQFNHENRYNAHNQFLQTYLQTGIFGFTILVGIFIVLTLRLKGSRSEFSIFLILFVYLLVESMLVRFNGIAFFSIVVPLLLKKRSILGAKVIRNTERVILLRPDEER